MRLPQIRLKGNQNRQFIEQNSNNNTNQSFDESTKLNNLDEKSTRHTSIEIIVYFLSDCSNLGNKEKHPFAIQFLNEI